MDGATAFNLGADARLRGEPLSTCPFTTKWAADWRCGWRDVDCNYGAEARKPYRHLPEVWQKQQSR